MDVVQISGIYFTFIAIKKHKRMKIVLIFILLLLEFSGFCQKKQSLFNSKWIKS